MKFTKATEAKTQGDAIVFNMELNGVVRQFEISGDVLRRRFGAADDTAVELLKAFESGADSVRDAAQRVRSVPAEGSIQLGAGDFS
ncbi:MULTISPECIES: DUF1488 family protein [unclassified Bordetella]|uniref:DUF1488 family protein n=1 Tax=unclassified Bordetella TaxID=2630031 RepID=UPI001329823A|nr:MULTISPECIES: DUF1488 family protein [unclassified Bordetella]MVW73211.1 DUF1488 family protein [Bordetella sp. 15P40C-2]MVW79872.1 DUF1488 family protein [Bordetella sp. 02P26C-1]